MIVYRHKEHQVYHTVSPEFDQNGCPSQAQASSSTWLALNWDRRRERTTVPLAPLPTQPWTSLFHVVFKWLHLMLCTRGFNDPHAYIMLVTIVLLCFVRYRIATVRNVESTKFDGIIQRHMFDRFISALQVIFSPSVGQSVRISFDWTFQNGHVDQFGEDTVFCSPKKKHGVYSVFPPQKMT